MDLKTIWFIFAITAGIFMASKVMALTPPHVDGTVPDNNGTLEGDTVVLTGYSLRLLQKGSLARTLCRRRK